MQGPQKRPYNAAAPRRGCAAMAYTPSFAADSGNQTCVQAGILSADKLLTVPQTSCWR